METGILLSIFECLTCAICSIHYCVCETCALQIFRSDRKQCPICRMQIERVITQVQSPQVKIDSIQRSYSYT